MSSGFLLAFKILDLLLLGVQMAPAVAAKMQALRGEMQVFIDEDRDPTPDEWKALNARITQREDNILTD